MWLTRLAFWYLPDPRFTACLGGFGPKLDPSRGPSAATLQIPVATPPIRRSVGEPTHCRCAGFCHEGRSCAFSGPVSSSRGAAAPASPLTN